MKRLRHTFDSTPNKVNASSPKSNLKEGKLFWGSIKRGNGLGNSPERGSLIRGTFLSRNPSVWSTRRWGNISSRWWSCANSVVCTVRTVGIRSRVSSRVCAREGAAVTGGVTNLMFNYLVNVCQFTYPSNGRIDPPCSLIMGVGQEEPAYILYP